MTLSLILIGVFLLLQGLYSGLETGLVSMRRPRVENAAGKGSDRARKILFFMDKPGLMISTTLLGVNISVVCASLAAKNFFTQAHWDTPEKLLPATFALSILMLICELLPKNYFRESPFQRCSRVIYLLYGTYFLLCIPARIFTSFTDFLSRLVSGKQTASVESARMREDLRLFIRESESMGRMHREAAVILDNAVAFHARRIRDVMIPLDRVAAIPETATVAEAAQLCMARAVTHVPVLRVQGKPGEWIGVFSLPDAIFGPRRNLWEQLPVRSLMKEPLALDANAGVLETLQKSRFQGRNLYFVVENGYYSGVLPLFDLTTHLFSEP